MLVLFNKVATPPVADSQITAFWHFGWNPPDQRKKVEELLAQGFKFAPLWTGIGDGSVTISSDTYPGRAAFMAWAKPRNRWRKPRPKASSPPAVPGFAYLMGPDNALIEVAGESNPERFNHVHMWEDEPFCAQLWYQKHLNAKVRTPAPGAPVYTEANCHVPRGVPTWPSLDQGRHVPLSHRRRSASAMLR